MTRFRPCIDLHQGRVKQIVGGSLRDDGAVQTNFVSDLDAAWYAERYREDQVTGGHIIQLGPGNQVAAAAALKAWPGGLQLGGGVTIENASDWIAAGASHVIVTSWLFDEQFRFVPQRLSDLSARVGRQHLVVDLSCRRKSDGWVVSMNRWQTDTDLRLTRDTLHKLAPHCAEFLVHAADVEGLRAGMDLDLLAALGEWSPIPVTYAGGASSFSDLARAEGASGGRVDLTIGSALDLFGGSVSYQDCVAWNRRGDHSPSSN